MPADLRFAAGADAKTRPPEQVAWMFDMTMDQAAEVKLQDKKVFKVIDGSLGKILEVANPAELIGSVPVVNDAEHGRLISP